MFSVTLGIDLGTTSVKICAVSDDDQSILRELSSQHNATVPNLPDANHHEQDPMKIYAATFDLLEKAKLSRVDKIVISGQMHGVVLWEHKSALDYVYGQEESINCSNLVTWMDQRCAEDFLK